MGYHNEVSRFWFMCGSSLLVVCWQYDSLYNSKGLSSPRTLGRFGGQGNLLSAMLYAIATHPLILYIDDVAQSGEFHELTVSSGKCLIAQASADESFFPKSNQNDLRALMDALRLYSFDYWIDDQSSKA